MAIEFKDGDRVYGRITDSLEVEYSGRFSSKIEEFVSGLDDFSNDDRKFEDEDVMMHIILELPEIIPVVDVRRLQ